MKQPLAILEFHHLGDAVMAIPFLKGARETHTPVVFCRAPVASLLQVLLPDVATQVLPDSWSGRFFRFPRLPREAAAVCVWPDLRAHALMARSGAGVRAGFALEPGNFYAAELPWRARKLRAARLASTLWHGITRRQLLTHPLSKTSPRQSHHASWKQLADALQIPLRDSLPWVDPANFHQPSLSLPGGPGPLLILHAGGRLPTKRWTGFQNLLATPTLQRVRVGIIAPPGEPHPQPASPFHQVIPTPDFSSLVAALARADGVLANDSLAAHLAAALGKPVVSIFGSGEPAWFSPFGNSHRVVITRNCPHHPCIDRCTMPEIICLQGVQVSQVLLATETMLAQQDGSLA